jgi:L-alanine-DL-glutamate epimerase-like enolase superfamily enzyme
VKITDVRFLQLVRPLDRPQRNAQGARNERRFNLVLVDTAAGLTGLGDAFGDDALMETIVVKRLRPMAIGLDPCDIPRLWHKLFASRAFWETAGSVVCGISAIEVACWDIRGQAEGVPVCELLGGCKRDRIQAYASDLHWEEPERMAALASQYVEQGFPCVKTHIGAPGERQRDLERMRRIREAIGPETGFMVDINTAFDRPTALSFGREIASFSPYWYEEPLSPLDWQGHAWLRRELGLKIATGENLYAAEGFQPLLAGHGCDFVMPDILRCGGIEQTRRVCDAARAAGIVASPHNYASGVGLAATLHLMAALPETQWLEFDTTRTAVYEELFIEPLAVEGGFVRVPQGPGLGVRLTAEVVDRYSRA